MLRKFIFVLLFVNVSFGETLQEVINIALEESPFLKSYIYQTKSIEGEIAKAKSIKNPNLNIEFGRIYSQIDGESGFNITSFSIQQPLRLWGEKKYSIQSAKLKKIAFDSFYQFQKNILISNIYKTFYSALSVKEKIKIKTQEIQNLENLYQFVSKSYKLGEIIQLDVLRVEKDLSIAKVQLEKLKADLQVRLNTISFLTGKEIKDVEGDFYLFNKIKQIDLEEIPEILYLKYLIESLNQQIKRQKALSKPKVSIGLVAGEDEVDLGKYDFGFSISSTVPVFYRNQGEIIQILNRKKSLYAKLNQTKLNYESSFNSIKKQLEILINQYTKVNNEVIESVSKALNLAEKSYKLKTITFFEFSNIRQQYYDSIYYKIQLVEEIQNLYGDYIKIGGLK